MSENPKYDITELLKKYVQGTSTHDEWEYLNSYLRRSRSSEDIDEALRKMWTETSGDDRGEIDLDSILKSELSRDTASSKIFKTTIIKWSAAAAVFAGLFIWFFWGSHAENVKVYETGYGENIEFVLEDGSRIHLNANSKLTWKKNWKNTGIRQVRLEGEAYFDVEHLNEDDDSSARMPFEVYTPDLTIRVLGTSFNAIQRRGKTEVLLDEGEVELALHRVEKKDESESNRKLGEEITVESEEDVFGASGEGEVVKMVPGEWVSFSSMTDELLQKTVESPESITEWKEGTLFYRDVEFQFMLENLEDIYGKTFEVTDSVLLKTRVDVGVPYEDWETVIDMMKWMLDIDLIESEDNQVRIKRKEN